jgi:OOP family OmpA-OmpF porin
VEHSLSPRGLRWRIESWRTGVPFAQVVIKHTLIYRVEQVFLIHAETGLLLAHVPEEQGDDATLVSGMLTAIRDFVADSFQSRDTGELRTFSVGDVCVLAEPGPRAYLAAVVRGQHAPALVEKLQRTLEAVHVRWADALAAFDGDTAPFAGVRPLLEDCLDTVLADDTRPRRRGLARFAWAVPVALLLLALGVPLARARRRWRAAVAAIEREPGLVLVRADRGWTRWSFAGLRDPLARDPSALLASLGVDTASVDARWAPFVSTAAPLALARARHVLAPPPTVTLRMRRDTLVAEGTASATWTARAATLAPALPGVAAVSLGGVSQGLPAPLEALRRDAESRHVFFAVGSAALDSAARAEIAAFAATYTRLRREAGGRGFDVAVRLAGRSDPTGGEMTNRDLSRRRAEAVRDVLAALGTAGVTGVDALGSSEPLPASGGDRARVNRSVSFGVEARLTGGDR